MLANLSFIFFNLNFRNRFYFQFIFCTLYIVFMQKLELSRCLIWNQSSFVEFGILFTNHHQWTFSIYPDELFNIYFNKITYGSCTVYKKYNLLSIFSCPTELHLIPFKKLNIMFLKISATWIESRLAVGRMFGGCFEQDLTSCWVQIRRRLGAKWERVRSR